MKFRLKALAKQREADELDTPTVLTSPRGWLALLCLGTVTLVAIAWAVFGRLPETVSAAGLITSPGGAAQVQSRWAGMVTAVHLEVGGQVRSGQDIAVVSDALGASHPVASLFTGQVISVEVAEGDVIGTGTAVAVIERGAPGATQRVAVLFASPSQAAGIAVGESVGLSVETAPSVAFGRLRGRVLAVGKFPLTAAEMTADFAGVLPGATLAADVGRLLVTVSLQPDSRTASGYAWTTAAGAPQAPPLLAAATGTVTLGEQAPLSLLFGG